MKTNLMQTAVAILALAPAGYAQSAQELKVTVPFDFVAGSRALAAGQYQYTISQAGNPSAVVIRSVGSATGVIMIANRVAFPGRQEFGKLVFHRYGNHYFLSEVWGTDQDMGSQVPKAAQER